MFLLCCLEPEPVCQILVTVRHPPFPSGWEIGKQDKHKETWVYVYMWLSYSSLKYVLETKVSLEN